MKKIIKTPNSLILINILTLILILIIAFLPQNALRIILGLPFMLFFPGYALSVALFPRKGSVSTAERVALSFGLSIMSTVFAGLAMRYTPWGVGLYPILLALSFLITAASVFGLYRWQHSPLQECITLSARFALPQWPALSRLDKTLSITLILLVVGIIAVLCYGYLVVIPREGEQFTEFYVVTPGGEASNYPSELTVGKEATVVLGVVNHEGQETNYLISVTIDGVKNGEMVSLILSPGEKREEEISFVPQKAVRNQKVEFILYKNGETTAYATLHLFIDAT